MTGKLLDNGKFFYILTKGKEPLIFDKSNEEDIEELEEILFFFFNEIEGLTKLEDFFRVGVRNGKSFNFIEKWTSQLPLETFDMEGGAWALPRWDTSEFNKGELREMRDYFTYCGQFSHVAWYMMNEVEPNLMLWKEFFKVPRPNMSALNLRDIIYDYQRDFVCLDTLMSWNIDSINSERRRNRELFDIRRRYPEEIPYEDYFEHGDWIIRSPVNYEEVYIEGEEMNHCVGGYLSDIRDEMTEIYFMRRKEEPNTPYITIEVKDDRVTQHFKASNRDPDAYQKDIIYGWAEERGYDIDIQYTEAMHHGL